MTDKEFENLEVGKRFTFGARKFEVVEKDNNGCDDCCFFGMDCEYLVGGIPECIAEKREDKKGVVFIEVEDDRN